MDDETYDNLLEDYNDLKSINSKLIEALEITLRHILADGKYRNLEEIIQKSLKLAKEG